MKPLSSSQSPIFNSFSRSLAGYVLPETFKSPFGYEPHPISLLAVAELQSHLRDQQDWIHNFGLGQQAGPVVGKMFGILVIRTQQNEIGYLAAFSGKLGGRNHHAKFVPPIFDGMEEGGFLNSGMTQLARMNEAIGVLEDERAETFEQQVLAIKTRRKRFSVALQNRIFDQYQFLNRAGDKKGLRDIFEEKSYQNPPAGAGECAAPKLLQYAFQHRMTPIAMAEFWWGLSPKSATWKHGHFYPACREKCEPILNYMLEGMEFNQGLNWWQQ